MNKKTRNDGTKILRVRDSVENMFNRQCDNTVVKATLSVILIDNHVHFQNETACVIVYDQKLRDSIVKLDKEEES